MVHLRQEYQERLACFLYYSNIPEDVVDVMQKVRQFYVALGAVLVDDLPECRSKSLALTYLEDSLMRSIQALALQGDPEVYDDGKAYLPS